MDWVYVGITLVLTVYSQLVIKWQVIRRGHLPATLNGKFNFFMSLLLNPWVLSAMLATFIAALCWMAAMTHLELSKAYPFTALTFITVLILSGVFFGDAITPGKTIGIALVIAGLVIGVRL